MLDDEAREEKELDLTFPDVVTKYKTAVEIVNKALQLVVSQCKPKAKVVDLFEKGDSFIRELSSFPVSFDRPSTSDRFDLAPASSLRAIWTDLWGPLSLYHACIPLFQAKLGNDENVLEKNDIVKIDMGCHIDGFIIVVAHTHVIQEGPVIGRAADVIDAANIAAEVALRLVRPGKKKDLVTPDSSSPSSGTCSSGPPPSAKDATCYMSSTQSSPVDQDDKDGSSPEGHVTEPAMETMKDKFLNPIKKQDKNRLTVHGPQISSSRCKPFLTSHKEKTSTRQRLWSTRQECLQTEKSL
ncbi:ERBB-3 BINDING PROTEIN 1-like isoform X2 [Zingiber officinale]|uniref:ERBB-3 BINDING PROTEIN 1-like isoform X2 n=1 Tax=Zingiber officinale TaxID=94328 RepID=UPI001C4C1A2D|nr:ERBB-3 BINDING PROTEIN 1-like isoform X2 [Zingiber officinale]